MKACNACGKCCIKYSNGQLSASEQDIAIWQSLRPDIADFIRDGKIWFSPDTGELIERCPWLIKDSESSRYLCEIYLDRPEDCRVYPSSISDMINDECEMLEPNDLINIKQAQLRLEAIMLENQD